MELDELYVKFSIFIFPPKGVANNNASPAIIERNKTASLIWNYHYFSVFFLSTTHKNTLQRT